MRFFKIGDLITRVGVPAGKEYDINWGGFAEFGIAKDHWSMYRDGLDKKLFFPYRVNQVVPAGIEPAEATMIITWRETLSYLKRMGIKPGSRILVTGSGGNALAFAAHAGNLGASCIVLTGNRQREPEARAAGATGYFDYQSADVANEIGEKYPEGFDFIIDAVGRQGNLDNVIHLLTKEGTLGVYGLDNFNTYTLNPWKPGGSFKFYNGGYNEEETHDEVLGFMKKGLLDAGIWMDLSNPLALKDIGDAFSSEVPRSGKVKKLIRLKA